MVGIVSHDLRNPLSAILMGAKLLARGETSADRLRVLGHVDSSAQRAQRLIEELLDFTLVRVGRGLAVAAASLDLHALAAKIVEELALAFPDRTIVHRAEGTGHCIADADRVAQLLGNLVGNAMAYGEPGGTVTVTSTLRGKRPVSACTTGASPSRQRYRHRSSSPWCGATPRGAPRAAWGWASSSCVPSHVRTGAMCA